jgi:hypothetical protein
MQSKLPVNVHPVAAIFPMMTAEEFDGLKSDIQANGVREWITFWKGELIDGRNRLSAMLELGIDWKGYTCELDDDADPVSHVISHNLHRRHLSTSQRAMVAAKLRPMFEGEAKERQKRKPESVPAKVPGQKKDSRDAAGEALKVSGKTVDAATKVLESKNQTLIAEVEQGKTSVSAAAKQLKADQDKASGLIGKITSAPKPPKKSAKLWCELSAKLDSFNDLFEKHAQECDEAAEVCEAFDKLRLKFDYYVRNVEAE